MADNTHMTKKNTTAKRILSDDIHDYIRVRGANEHNLKHIKVNIPRDTLTVFTGLSGSGKSSLAFDTIFAEGQRRYMESLSSYARMFLGQMDKPDVEKIEGLSPTISIDQKSTNPNPFPRLAYHPTGGQPPNDERTVDLNDHEGKTEADG